MQIGLQWTSRSSLLSCSKHVVGVGVGVGVGGGGGGGGGGGVRFSAFRECVCEES